MIFNIKIFAMINLSVQILLIILLSYAAFYVRRNDLSKHCNIIRVAVILQLITITTFMLPSILGYIRTTTPYKLFNQELVLHHFLGLVLLAAWIYINLVYAGKVRWPGNFRFIMRSAYTIWALSFIIGLHIYINIYL